MKGFIAAFDVHSTKMSLTTNRLNKSVKLMKEKLTIWH